MGEYERVLERSRTGVGEEERKRQIQTEREREREIIPNPPPTKKKGLFVVYCGIILIIIKGIEQNKTRCCKKKRW